MFPPLIVVVLDLPPGGAAAHHPFRAMRPTGLGAQGGRIPDERGHDETLEYVGHATLLIELAGARLLTDPLLGNVAHLRRLVPAPRRGALTGLDAVLISHAHRDHLDLPSLRRIANGCLVIAPAACTHLLQRCG